MKIHVTSLHLQPISRKEKRRLVNDIVILRLFTSWVNVSVFLLKEWPKKFREIAGIIEKNFESKIREHAGPQTVNREWVRVCCIYINVSYVYVYA